MIDLKVFRKILRSVLKRFQLEVTAIEKSKNADKLKLDEL